MAKAKSTKRALLMSVLSMLLCVSMLVGSTFAWFTDSVTSGNNRIVAGNLDVELEYRNASTNGEWKNASKEKTETPNFFVDKDGKDILWEPGVMAVTQFRVVNKGTLALKYSLATLKADFNALDGHDLSEVIKFAKIDNDKYTADTTREGILAQNPKPEFEDFTGFAAEGELYPKKNAPDENETNEPFEEIFTVVAYWEPNVKDDNLYNVNNGKEVEPKYQDKDGKPINQLYIDIEIQLIATQYSFEQDSFGKDYDAFIATGIISKDSESKIEISEDMSITVPENAVDDDVKATFAVQVVEDTESAQTYEISLKDAGGNPISLNVPATVTINAGKNKEIAGVKHSGVAMTAAASSAEMTDGTYYYDAETGILSICTSSFSPFEVEWRLSQAQNAEKLTEKGYAAVSNQADFVNAINAGKSIVLTGDVEAAYSNDVNRVPLSFNNANADVVLDLNGHELTCGPKTSGSTLIQYSMVVNAGKVTIVDTYGDGKVLNTVLVKGTDTDVTINDVDVNAVSVQDGANLTVNGGTFADVGGKKSNNDAPAPKVTLNKGTFGTVVVTGGIVNIYEDVTVTGSIGASSTTYNIYGGMFAKIPNGSSMTVNIYGGTFTDADSYSWNTSTYMFAGGTFGNRTSAFPDKYLAEGKQCVKTADKTYSVVDK